MMKPSQDKSPVIYFPGLDGTGRLLCWQQELTELYEVQCESYPQDRTQTYEELADAAAGRFRGHHPDRRAIVLAESFGGAVGITFALRHADLVERMVFVNTFARFPARVRIRLAAWLGRFLPRKPAYRFTRPIRSFFFFNKDVSREIKDEWWTKTDDVPMRAFGYRLRLIAGLDLRPRLEEIRCPCLVLVAPNDLVVPPESGRELAKSLPNSKLFEKNVGHAAMAHPDIKIPQLLEDPSLWPPAGETK